MIAGSLAAGLDIEKAIAILRQEGASGGREKSDARGYGRARGKLYPRRRKDGVLVEVTANQLRCALREAFQHLCHDIAMHIAALDPKYVRREEVTRKCWNVARDLSRGRQHGDRSIPDRRGGEIVILVLRMEKFYGQLLYGQHYIKDDRNHDWLRGLI